jgi:iron complex outermembrane receptor protein
MRTTLAWDQRPFRAFVAVNYIGEYDNDLLASVQRVGAWTTIDANLTMDFGDADGFTIGLDARNLFDEDPPYVNVAPNGNGSGGYDASAANPTGRVLGVSLRKRF